MKKVSMRKLSVLGVVLLAASAVTAAVMPKDKSEKSAAQGNRLVASTSPDCGNQVTCVTTDDLGVNECNYTVGTKTSIAPSRTSYTTNGINKTTSGGGTVAGQNSSQAAC